MLSNFYLIILLLCIEWTLSYNRIEDASGKLPISGRYAKRTSKIGKNKVRKKLIHQKYNKYENSPMNFDVSRFMHPDDELYGEEVASRHCDKKSRRSSNNKDYQSLVDKVSNEGNKKKEKSQEFLSFAPTANSPEKTNQPVRRDNAKLKPPNSLVEMNAKYSSQLNDKNKNLYETNNPGHDKNPTHHQTKKCAFKRIQMPFFFHNKETMTKKPKKRKLFFFGSSKKSVSHATEANKTNNDPLVQYKVKRSHQEKLSPASKKKTIDIRQSDRPKKTALKMIHNSRQFFQRRNSFPKLKAETLKRNLEDYGIPDGPYRKKREETAEMKLKQLKELEEVQKKIDNVRVSFPELTKLPGRPIN